MKFWRLPLRLLLTSGEVTEFPTTYLIFTQWTMPAQYGIEIADTAIIGKDKLTGAKCHISFGTKRFSKVNRTAGQNTCKNELVLSNFAPTIVNISFKRCQKF